MRPYSQNLRLRVVQAYENREGSMRQLAVRFRLSLSCVRDLLTRYRATGDVAPKPHGAAIQLSWTSRSSTPSRASCTPLLRRHPRSSARVCPPSSRSR
jgi:transposase